MSAGSIEMPRYLCHKEVHALQILAVRDAGVGATLMFTDTRYAPMDVNIDYMRKHKPFAGGYYVVYDDGYASFSPAAAFESGYTLKA